MEAWNQYSDNILDRRILPERNVKIYHTEFNEFKAELERHNLHKRLTNLQDGSIDLALVKEFYANLYSLDDQSPKQVKVRGHLIRIDADSLNTFLETPVVLEEGETLPTYSWFSECRGPSLESSEERSHHSCADMECLLLQQPGSHFPCNNPPSNNFNF